MRCCYFARPSARRPSAREPIDFPIAPVGSYRIYSVGYPMLPDQKDLLKYCCTWDSVSPEEPPDYPNDSDPTSASEVGSAPLTARDPRTPRPGDALDEQA